VWDGCVGGVRGVLGWGSEAARFYDGVKDFVGKESVLFTTGLMRLPGLCIFTWAFSVGSLGFLCVRCLIWLFC
jgi:hypothetical protein